MNDDHQNHQIKKSENQKKTETQIRCDWGMPKFSWLIEMPWVVREQKKS
jgi:hypothetical protein